MYSPQRSVVQVIYKANTNISLSLHSSVITNLLMDVQLLYSHAQLCISCVGSLWSMWI